MRYPDFSEAACNGIPTEIFYPESDKESDLATIRRICSGCPVVVDCYKWALHHENHGIWAGSTKQERRLERAKRNIPLVTPTSVITAGAEL